MGESPVGSSAPPGLSASPSDPSAFLAWPGSSAGSSGEEGAAARTDAFNDGAAVAFVRPVPPDGSPSAAGADVGRAGGGRVGPVRRPDAGQRPAARGGYARDGFDVGSRMGRIGVGSGHRVRLAPGPEAATSWWSWFETSVETDSSGASFSAGAAFFGSARRAMAGWCCRAGRLAAWDFGSAGRASSSAARDFTRRGVAEASRPPRRVPLGAGRLRRRLQGRLRNL